jgi:hypothetical protein
MAKYEVQIVESRDLVFEVEADSDDEAQELAMEMDSSDAIRDSYRDRAHDWTAKL